jgi:hypothetical protein
LHFPVASIRRVPISVAAGHAAGAIIAALTVVLEHSRVAFGAYALYGNGALIVPSLLAPFALYPGWTWILRRGGRALELALYVLGLHLGVGLVPVLEVVFFPASPDLTLLNALPGLLLTGAIFVEPAALLAAIALWWIRRMHGVSLSAALGIAVVVSASLGFVYGIGLGVLVGTAVALAERLPRRTWIIGAGLAVLLLVLGNLPYLSQPVPPAP